MSEGINSEWLEEAYSLGVDAAKAAASWVTDGNESDESRRQKIAMMNETFHEACEAELRKWVA